MEIYFKCSLKTPATEAIKVAALTKIQKVSSSPALKQRHVETFCSSAFF